MVMGCLTFVIPTTSKSKRKSFLMFCKSDISFFLVGFVRTPGLTEPNNLWRSALLGSSLPSVVLFIALSPFKMLANVLKLYVRACHYSIYTFLFIFCIDYIQLFLFFVFFFFLLIFSFFFLII